MFYNNFIFHMEMFFIFAKVKKMKSPGLNYLGPGDSLNKFPVKQLAGRSCHYSWSDILQSLNLPVGQCPNT
jgi:hypothetical protein